MFNKLANKVISILVSVDFFYNSAFGSFAPVFAIFINNQIEGGSPAVAGYATAFYWVTKSSFQLFIARFLDRTDGERDEFWAVFFGYILSGFVPIGYYFAREVWHVYLLQAFLGFAMAWAIPAWYSIFTRHVDKWRISFEWSLQSVFAVGLAYAVSAALGGVIAERYGFRFLFLLSGILAIGSSFLLLALRKHLLPKDHREKVIPEGSHHH